MLYLSLHKDKSLFDTISENYENNKVVFLCDEDLHSSKCCYKVF